MDVTLYRVTWSPPRLAGRNDGTTATCLTYSEREAHALVQFYTKQGYTPCAYHPIDRNRKETHRAY